MLKPITGSGKLVNNHFQPGTKPVFQLAVIGWIYTPKNSSLFSERAIRQSLDQVWMYFFLFIKNIVLAEQVVIY